MEIIKKLLLTLGVAFLCLFAFTFASLATAKPNLFLAIAFAAVPCAALFKIKIATVREILVKTILSVAVAATIGLGIGLCVRNAAEPITYYNGYYNTINKEAVKEQATIGTISGVAAIVAMGFIWFVRPANSAKLEQELKRKKEQEKAA